MALRGPVLEAKVDGAGNRNGDHALPKSGEAVVRRPGPDSGELENV
ncbi:MAG TPA: hypothetical protein VNM14_02795 [Planctomycetota bacterium]|nr:hypothetical protein [Planctomycetota bacterium]